MLSLLFLHAVTAPSAPVTPFVQETEGAPQVSTTPVDPGSARPHGLFNPVPRDRMRDLSADRPDTTESPITVDAGHIQLEISIGDWSRERRDDAVTLMQSNVKFGLDDKTDIQFVFDTWVLENNGGGDDAHGFGDVQIRLKRNLWGNDGETEDAFALFPYVKIPTGARRSNDELEGGLILPYAMPLTESLDLGLMGQFDAVYDESSEEHDLEFLHTAVLGYPIEGNLGGFLEYVGVLGEGSDYVASTNLGITYESGPDLLLDAGVRLGLSDEADDLGLFLGFTYRY